MGKMLAVLLFLGIVVGTPIYTYGTARDITVQVTDKERTVTGSGDSVSSYWLIFTKDHDVLENTDSWLWLKFNSSSVYGKLERGKTYNLKIYGWRVPFLSMYPNIIKING